MTTISNQLEKQVIKNSTISNPLEKLVIRKIIDGSTFYLAIMEESIAKLGNGKFLNYDNPHYYKVFCDHVRDCKNIRPEKCGCHNNILICSYDVFYLPTVDDYIKLGIILRRKRKRFNFKKNEIITLK